MNASEVETLPSLRVFLASPGDVKEERAVALAVLQRIQRWFQGRIRVVPVYWEGEPLSAGAGFQEEIARRAPPRDTDVALFVLWSRLGFPVGAELALPDGRRPSGTEWEFLDAQRANREGATPYMLVYRKTAPVAVTLDRAKAEREEAERQWQALGDFFARHFRDARDLSFTGSYHAFESAAEFGTLLETHLTKLLDERLGTSQITWRECPYRGLEVFESRHAPIYFGRSRAIQEVRQALAAQARSGRAFLVILGPSGNGKSSLLRAGLLPLLGDPRAVEEGLAGGVCRQALFRPADGANVLEALAKALLPEGALPELARSGGVAEIAAILGEGPKAAVGLVRGALAAVQPQPARLVLAIDQLEELFTGERAGSREAAALVVAVDAWARSGLVYVLATLRSDFYPQFAAVPAFRALKEGCGQYDLPLPDAAEVAQIIRLPAQAAGITFERHPKTGRPLDEALMAEAVAGPDALALLEYALKELYDRRPAGQDALRYATYEALGGVGGALACRAAQEWQALGEPERRAFPSVVRALVDVSEAGERSATKRRAPLAEAARAPGAPALIERFVGARLFVTDVGADGVPVVSVVHEALLRTWDELARQIRAEEVLLRTRTRVRAAAAAWEAAGRPAGDLDAGRRLLESQALLQRGFDLAPVERAFVEASAARARRLAWVRRGAVAAIAVLGILAGWLAWDASRGREREAGLRAESEADAERLADLSAVRDVLAARDVLFPDGAASVARATRMLEQATAAVQRLPRHRADLERLTALPGASARTRQVLQDLVRDAAAATQPESGALALLDERFRPASTQPIDWDAVNRALAACTDKAGRPWYPGLVLSAEFGLYPLGPAPESGLYEFAHFYSGTLPERAGDGSWFLHDDAAIVFVLIPGGSFWMGASKEGEHNRDPDAQDDEQPVRERHLRPFLLAKYECTQAQWRRLASHANPSSFAAGTPGFTPRHPVESVAWSELDGADGWPRRFGLSLPSEAEWEYACRAGTTTRFWSGDTEADLARVGWYEANSGSATHPVGEKPANAWGLYDVHGNVWEWCADDGHSSYTGAPSDGSAWIDSPRVGARVVRGGGWYGSLQDLRSAGRGRFLPSLRNDGLGFRLARAVTTR